MQEVMERFLRLALLFFLLATGVGLVLRYAMVEPVVGLVFGHALHAHSHTLYFGWAALALFTLFFERVGATDPMVRRALWAVVGVSLATLVAFLHSGYGRPGVVVSAVALVVWGLVVGLFFRRAHGRSERDVAWMRVGAWYVVVAALAAGARVVLLVTKADPLWGKLAVAGFLTAFAGFFLFGVVALLMHFLEQRGAKLDARLLRWQLGWMTPLTALTFPLGVPGAMETPLGPLARVAAVLLVVPAALWLANLWSASHSVAPGCKHVLRSIGVMWAVKAVFEVGAAFGLDALAATSRHAVILQIHLVLLGVVSASLLLVVRARLGRVTGPALLLHQAGVGVLCFGLLLAALSSFGAASAARLGLWLALAGAAVVWVVDLALVLDGLDLKRLRELTRS
jgi:hypothetical protein